MEGSMSDEKVVTEIFNQARMDRCTQVFGKIEEHWMKKGFACRVVADGDVNGKSLEDLDKMYFQVGVGDDLTSLPFLDMLVVFSMIADVANKHSPMKDNKDGTHTRQMKIKTAFTESEAFAYLRDIAKNIGIEVVPPTIAK